MSFCNIRCFLLVALAPLFALAGSAFAAEPTKKERAPAELAPLPKPAEVQTLTATPERIVLEGSDASQQLVITATLTSDRLQDLSSDVEYESADPKVARVSRGGRIVPVVSGKTEVAIRYGGREVKVPVETKAIEENLPINFGNQIVPVFTKLGCNSGGCHGKASGQNGFKLSLLGFEPDVDYAALVKEGRGRRLFPASPDHSLLLLKATGQTSHGGGKRMEVGSDEYKLVRRWIAAGTPFGRPDDPVVASISVYPPGRTMTRQNKQQLAVYAHYSDGRVEDITRRAQYESNDTEVAIVDSDGMVRSLALSGEAAIMARYHGQMTVFRATVPLGAKVPQFAFEPKTNVDRYTAAKWRQLGIVPSDLCTDEEFIRRASLDITGTLPTPAQLRAFSADPDPDKRDKLVDRFVDSVEHSFYFANKWADILRVKRGNNINRAYGTFVFHDWLHHAIAEDKRYDEFAREILSAVGDETKCPPVVWYKDLQTPDQFVDNAAQVFLGTRLQCAQCHHHPYEKWSQDDYWGLAAFFGRLGRKAVPVAGLSIQNQQQQRQVLFTRPSGAVTNKRTNQPAVMKVLDGSAVDVSADQDPRQKLVDWLVAGNNPFFAKAVANRYWAHFFNRGIVDPLDDMRVTNPPSNPELLDALSKDFVDHGFSLKHLVRTICKSRTYQLSATPNEFNKHDKQAYARYYPRRMAAEVLFDAVCQATDSPTTFNGLPRDAHSPHRAIMLPDESFQSYFLDVFGRPQRLSACECERVSEANLAQALHLLNSEEIQGKVSRQGGRVDAMVKDPRPDAEKVEELFLWTVGHKPSDKQMSLALEHVQANEKNKKGAYENILWALINTKEFVFNR
jgi:hypothetical protein